MMLRNFFKKIYYALPAITKKDDFFIAKMRHKKYLKMEKLFLNSDLEGTNIHSNSKNYKRIYVFWYQGYEQAPPIVRRCIDSIKEKSGNFEFNLITKDNLSDYANGIPKFIWEKLDNGAISLTHFSDILRFYLLSSQGGIWIDSTCLLKDDIPKDVLQSNPFFFKSRANIDGDVVASTWFIVSLSYNPIITDVYSMLINYWRTHKKILDYFLCHFFITIAFKRHPEYWYNMPFYHNLAPHYIQYCLLEKTIDEKYDFYLKKSFIHKLTYKIEKAPKESLYDELNNY